MECLIFVLTNILDYVLTCHQDHKELCQNQNCLLYYLSFKWFESNGIQSRCCWLHIRDDLFVIFIFISKFGWWNRSFNFKWRITILIIITGNSITHNWSMVLFACERVITFFWWNTIASNSNGFSRFWLSCRLKFNPVYSGVYN